MIRNHGLEDPSCQAVSTQREVALKVPGRKRLASATNLEAFLQEARAAAGLKHPGLVVVYDIQQDDDGVYIVQEYNRDPPTRQCRAVRAGPYSPCAVTPVHRMPQR